MSTEHAKRIRTVYKARGWNSRDVSVRCSAGCAIDIKISSPRVHRAEAERIAHSFEVVRRDDRSGEILSGGNLFIFVEQTPECLALLAEPYIGAARNAIARAIAACEPSRGFEIAPDWHIFVESPYWAKLWGPDGPVYFDPRSDAELARVVGGMAEALKPAYTSPDYCREFGGVCNAPQ